MSDSKKNSNDCWRSRLRKHYRNVYSQLKVDILLTVRLGLTCLLLEIRYCYSCDYLVSFDDLDSLQMLHVFHILYFPRITNALVGRSHYYLNVFQCISICQFSASIFI